VLGWAVSQRDLELLIKLVGQLISSAAADGGATIVVLTQREKLEMEELFRWGVNCCASPALRWGRLVPLMSQYVRLSLLAAPATLRPACARPRSCQVYIRSRVPLSLDAVVLLKCHL
jgi:hypothetical protein